MDIIGKNVGKTNITSTYTDITSQSDTKEFTVTAVSLGTISSISDSVYDGTEIRPLPTITAVVDGEPIELRNGIDYTLSYSDNINAGTATVTAQGIGNFTGTLQQNWTIIGATIEVVANNQTYDYDGQNHGVVISVTTVGNNDATIKYRTTPSGDYTITTTPQIRNVSQSGTVYFQVTADNHIPYEGSYNLQIIPREAILSWGTTTWRYDGNAHSTTCVIGNLVSGDTCTVQLTNNLITNVGNTTVRATGLNNNDYGNYVLPSDSSIEIIISITPGLLVKLLGEWTYVTKVFEKQGDRWVERNDVQNVFNPAIKYIKAN